MGGQRKIGWARDSKLSLEDGGRFLRREKFEGVVH